MFSEKPTGKPLGVLEKGMWVDFVENNERSKGMRYRRLSSRDSDDWKHVHKTSWTALVKVAFVKAMMLFAVSPFDLPGRIARSLVPPIAHKFRIIHVDLLGPTMAVSILVSLLIFGQAEKDHAIAVERVVFMYCMILPIVTYVSLRCSQAAITFMQLLTVIGYSLYGPVFTLLISLVIDHERSNAIFFVCLAIFGGLSTLRVVLVILASLRIPVARLLICSSVALFQLLFVVWLHFTYLHPTYVFGSGGSSVIID